MVVAITSPKSMNPEVAPKIREFTVSDEINP